MLFYMSSKTFLNLYLENEEDWKILDNHYVVISLRVRHTKSSYKIIDGNVMYPNSSSLYANEKKEFQAVYRNQLEREASAMLAEIVRISVKHGTHFIFLCSEKEYESNSSNYMKEIAKYIRNVFHYPIYEYESFAKRKCDLEPYDEDEVLSICKKILQDHEENEYRQMGTFGKVKKVMDKMEKKSKKEIVKYLEKRGYYASDESKKKLLSIIQSMLQEEYGITSLDD